MRARASKPVAAKKVVVSLVERDGKARSFHVANVHAATLRPLLFQNACRLSTLMTDQNTAYVLAGREYWSHSYHTTYGVSIIRPVLDGNRLALPQQLGKR